MDLNKYTTRLRDDLVAAAALGDEKTQSTAAALAAATENAARLTLLSVLSDLAAEVSQTLGDRTVHVSLDGADAHVDVRKNAPKADEEMPSFEDITGDISRVTLRMVDQIKSRAQQAAEQNGVSLNTWLSTTVQDALRNQRHWGPGFYDRDRRDSSADKRDRDSSDKPEDLDI